MTSLIHPTYLPNIASFVVLANTLEIRIEFDDNFQKQTYRNRAYIYGANGKLALNVPVRYTQKERQKYRDVKIANDEKWQDNHWKSIQSAYRTSPFFEYYEDDLKLLFTEPKASLFEFNLEGIRTIAECIDLDFKPVNTTTFIKDFKAGEDYRYLVNAKTPLNKEFDTYTQVFANKYGYLSNLSILDLLFNEGPNTLNYLQSQSI